MGHLCSSERTAIGFIQGLCRQHPRLTLIDMELLLPAGVTGDGVHKYTTCLRSHVRRGVGVFAYCLGAVWAHAWDEEGTRYLRVLFVFDGTALRTGWGRGEWIEWIEMFWRVVITEGKGGCRNQYCWYQEGLGMAEDGVHTGKEQPVDEVYCRLIQQMGQGAAVLHVIGVLRTREQPLWCNATF